MEKKFYFSILEVGDGPKTSSHQLVMQYLKFTLHFYKLKLFCFVQNLTILWNQCERGSVLNTSLRAKYHYREKCKRKINHKEPRALEGLEPIAASIYTKIQLTPFLTICTAHAKRGIFCRGGVLKLK